MPMQRQGSEDSVQGAGRARLPRGALCAVCLGEALQADQIIFCTHICAKDVAYVCVPASSLALEALMVMQVDGCRHFTRHCLTVAASRAPRYGKRRRQK